MIILIVLLTLFVFLFLFLAQAADNLRRTTRLAPSPTQPLSTPTPTPDETAYTEASLSANWKTYTLQSGFEVKYPQDWDFYEFNRNTATFGPRELVQTNRERLNNPNIGALIGGKAWPVEIKPLNNNIYLYGPNDVSFISDEQKKVSSTVTVINGIKALRYIIMFNYEAPYINMGDVIEVVVIKHGTEIYSITLSDKKHRDIFGQILSTFKFIEQTPTPTGNLGQVVCTQDVKQCPDGSYVARTGPACEFAPCPN